MINRSQILTAATALTLLFFAGTAAASGIGKLTYASEIKSCIAEVGERANYEDASIVRHMVVLKKQTGIGYVFTIDTSVFTDSDETAVRRYASYCVARDDDTPVKFRISQISG
jgi:hypothetical protein